MSIRSYDKVIRYGHLANMVYEPKDEFKEFVNVKYNDGTYMRYKQWISCLHTDTQCSIVENDDKILIIFRGVAQEKGLSEFLNDSEISSHISLSKRYTSLDDEFYAHTGFLKAYDSVQAMINNSVQVFNKDVVTIGHSLGGSLSQICALDLATAFPSLKIRSYTFGAPRIGNEQFIKLLDKYVRSLRVYHRLDPIAALLPEIFGYKHSNHTLVLGKKLWFFKWIKYHYMETYIDKLVNDRNKLYDESNKYIMNGKDLYSK